MSKRDRSPEEIIEELEREIKRFQSDLDIAIEEAEGKGSKFTYCPSCIHIINESMKDICPIDGCDVVLCCMECQDEEKNEKEAPCDDCYEWFCSKACFSKHTHDT